MLISTIYLLIVGASAQTQVLLGQSRTASGPCPDEFFPQVLCCYHSSGSIYEGCVAPSAAPTSNSDFVRICADNDERLAECCGPAVSRAALFRARVAADAAV
ncbi:hypothetical protein ANO11243_093860 [Dothideomycetidae sp. 11243]|nr:hypothetical protein ANO11243_093860 [fungal sp. No.11243]